MALTELTRFTHVIIGYAHFLLWYFMLHCSIYFVPPPAGCSWSCVGGSEASGKPKEEECTMNLARIERATVLHQFGHALGLEHEHQHPTAPLEWNQEKVQ